MSTFLSGDRPAAASASSLPSPHPPAIRILLVDAQVMVREGLALRLHLESDPVVIAQTAELPAALVLAAEDRPDVVILDPGVVGFGILRSALDRLHQSHPARVLVLAGESNPGLVQEALAAGAAGYLRKTDPGEELVRAIRHVQAGATYLSPAAATLMSRAATSGSAAQQAALTARELDVLRGIAEGLGHKEIGHRLGVSPKSVETYRARLTRKTGCATRAGLVRYAVRHGVVHT
jgi:DNA-binding NarL/FixJ family response regulator